MPRYKVHVRRTITEYSSRVDTAEIEVEADSDDTGDLNAAIRQYDRHEDIGWEYGDSEHYDSDVSERPSLDRDYDVEPLDEPDDDDPEPEDTTDDEPSEVDKLLAIAEEGE